jgi:hypothetical protein
MRAFFACGLYLVSVNAALDAWMVEAQKGE